ncbi:hypothetical protein ACWFNE_14110 [Cellulomonas sp. NPDC055163]
MVNVTGGQHATVINNVDGDQHNYDARTVGDGAQAAALGAVRDLRALLDGLGLDAATAQAARADVAEIEQAASAGDKERAGGSVERLTARLDRAGRLASAGAALVPPLRVLGGWLGALGAGVLQLLPG